MRCCRRPTGSTSSPRYPRAARAPIGGDLNIESLQDTARFDGKSQSVGVSATVGYGASVSGSISLGHVRNGYQQAAQAARQSGDAGSAAAYEEQARQAQTRADSWGDNGSYRVGRHMAVQAVVGGATGGAGSALGSAGGVAGGNLGQQLGKKLGEEEADRQGLQGQARTELVNGYQQALATLGGALAGGAASKAGGWDGSGGSGAGSGGRVCGGCQ